MSTEDIISRICLSAVPAYIYSVSITVIYSDDRQRRRAENTYIASISKRRFYHRAYIRAAFYNCAFHRSGGGYSNYIRKRRRILKSAQAELGFKKALVILLRGKTYYLVLRSEGLDNGASRLASPAAAPDDLRYKRKRPLSGAIIAAVKGSGRQETTPMSVTFSKLSPLVTI